MVETAYNYIISRDFPKIGTFGVVIPSQLKIEIDGSSIATPLTRIITHGDDIAIWFQDALSSADKTTLDGDTIDPAGGLIAAHNNNIDPYHETVDFYVEDLTESSHTGDTNYQLKLRLDLPGMPAGTYMLQWQYQWGESSTSAQYLGRVQVDGTDVISQTSLQPVSATSRAIASGFAEIILTPGTHYVDILYATDAAGKVAYSSRAKMWLKGITLNV